VEYQNAGKVVDSFREYQKFNAVYLRTRYSLAHCGIWTTLGRVTSRHMFLKNIPHLTITCETTNTKIAMEGVNNIFGIGKNASKEERKQVRSFWIVQLLRRKAKKSYDGRL
jgi:hypothetical protein